MTKKRHKLRLRKQVIMCIPVALFIITLAVFLVVDRESIFVYRSSGEATVVETSASFEIDDVVKLSERDFFVNLKKLIELRQKDNTVIYYALKFHLNIDKTLEIAHELTNDYEDEEYNTNYIIATSKYKKKIEPFDSFEAGVVYFVRDLYRYPERYGSSIAEIRKSEGIDSKKEKIDGVIYIDGLTFYQYLGKICDMYGVDKELALAISYQETGILTSNLFVNSNNLGGQKNYEGWARYTTLEAGIISYVLTLRNIIDKFNIDLTADNYIYTLSGPYVYGTSSKPSAHWAEKVTYFKAKIHEQDLFSIEN